MSEQDKKHARNVLITAIQESLHEKRDDFRIVKSRRLLTGMANPVNVRHAITSLVSGRHTQSCQEILDIIEADWQYARDVALLAMQAEGGN